MDQETTLRAASAVSALGGVGLILKAAWPTIQVWLLSAIRSVRSSEKAKAMALAAANAAAFAGLVADNEIGQEAATAFWADMQPGRKP